jgi:NAD(P)-dependent dehydrogenase (short-subunit alcohol dehydrogenase family)
MNAFQNKVAIVTGGDSGIGRAICIYLAKHDSQVIIADRDLDGARETESFIISISGHARSVRIDVSESHPLVHFRNL